MRHHNSVFHGIQKHVPWAEFERLVDKHAADRRVRRLDSKSQFLALLFGQLSGTDSLRAIETGLRSHADRLYHLGGNCVARSTLADANARRPAALFADLFAYMAGQASRATRRQIKDAVRILDATRIEMSSLSRGWLGTVSGHRAVKLHVAYDPVAATPLRAQLSDQRLNDITPAKAMPIEPGMTYVFDLGYYDFTWWAALDAAGCRFVSRLKSHTLLGVTAEQHVSEQGRTEHGILADRIGLLPQRMAAQRRNPFADPVREIVLRIDSGKVIRLLTNDLDASAEEIAGLYKTRWQIELFFKWIKQNLRIGRFLGTSQNAVRIQIFVALIAYILLRVAQARQTAVATPLAFARLVRLNLMHRRRVDQLIYTPITPIKNSDQMSLDLSPA